MNIPKMYKFHKIYSYTFLIIIYHKNIILSTVFIKDQTIFRRIYFFINIA